MDSKWKWILYSDELTPGNALGDARRKILVMYYSWLELGGVQLQQELCWFPLLALKSSVVNDLDDGLSQLTGAILRHLFLESAHKVQDGVFLKSAEGTLQYFSYEIGAILQDGLAHKSMFGCKGDTGTRCCFICKNLISERSSLQQDGESLLICKMHKPEFLQKATDTDIFTTIDRLVHNKSIMSSADFKRWEMACGFNYSPRGLLFQADLRPIFRPVSCFAHDWVQCVLSNGVFATCMNAWLAAVGDASGLDMYDKLSRYVPFWFAPKHQPMNLALLFSKKKKKANKEACAFKSTASEALALLPVLCYFIQAVLWPADVGTLENAVPWPVLSMLFVCRVLVCTMKQTVSMHSLGL